MKYAYKLSPNADIAKFKAAWEQTVEACENLRSRIINLDGSVFQVVVSDDIYWEDSGKTVRDFISESRSMNMGYGTRLNRYALIKEGGDTYFVHICHHSTADGWSMGLILSTLRHFYHNQQPPALAPYAGFIQHVQSEDQSYARGYWERELAGATPAAFPGAAKASTPSATRTVDEVLGWPQTAEESLVTKASIVRAAWAMVLARYSEADDITFGSTVSGRSAAVSGVERMSGPTIATVPVRVRLNPEQSLSDFALMVQAQGFEMTSYEQFGLTNIAKLSQDISDACDFSSLITVQVNDAKVDEDVVQDDLFNIAQDKLEGSLENYFSYPLVAACVVHEDGVKISLTYDTNVLSHTRIQFMAYHFSRAIQQLVQNGSNTLGQTSLIGSQDMERIARWNHHPLEPVNECLHDVISGQFPDREAIYTTAGSVTYKQLEDLSNRLANQLIQLGVTEETMIPICFEKSL
jgi:hypothetical protein